MTNNTPASEVPWTKALWQVSHGPDTSGYPVYRIHGFSAHEKRDARLHDANAALMQEAPTMAALLEAIDKSWTEYWPDGPDVRYEHLNLAEDTAAIWRGIRESLSRIRSAK